ISNVIVRLDEYVETQTENYYRGRLLFSGNEVSFVIRSNYSARCFRNLVRQLMTGLGVQFRYSNVHCGTDGNLLTLALSFQKPRKVRENVVSLVETFSEAHRAYRKRPNLHSKPVSGSTISPPG